MKTYRMTLFVRGDQLSTLLALLEGADGVQIGGDITDAADPTPLPPTPPLPRPSRPTLPAVEVVEEKPATLTGSRYVNGRRSKGIASDDLIIETLRSGPATLDELKRAFTHHGFAATSAGVVVSKMLRDGRIQRGMRGRLHLMKSADADDRLQKALPPTH